MTRHNFHRLQCLDAYRGTAIVGMILVNTPGSWGSIYPMLRHAAWHGCTPADLVFPVFLFIMGTSLALSYAKKQGTNCRAVVQRSIVLFSLGLLLNLLPDLLDWMLYAKPPNLSHLRIMGVLQRIGLVYLMAGVTVHWIPVRGIAAAGLLVLMAYWAAMTLIPLPGHGPGNLTPAGNFASYIDCAVITPKHLYRGGPHDPEGLLSTLPATVTVLAGYCFGRWVQVLPVTSFSSIKIMVMGLLGLACGYIWGIGFPINKALWTSSFVVYTAGWAMCGFALWYEILEVRRAAWPGMPFSVMGRNAILLYVGSGCAVRLLLALRIPAGVESRTVYSWIYTHCFASWLEPCNASLAFSLAWIMLWWVPLYLLYRRHRFLTLPS